MTIVVTPGNTQVVAVQASSDNTVTINKTELVLTVIHEPNSIVVTAPISSIVNVVTAGPQGARVNLIAPDPTYDQQNRIIEINYANNFRKVFTYDVDGYMITVDFYQPGLPTQRTTLTWLNGLWQGTSAPVNI
jgi:hypothetical protein